MQPFKGPLPLGYQMVFLACLVVAAVVGSAALGYIRLPVIDVARIIASGLLNRPEWIQDMNAVAPAVVLDVRLPRILCAALVGGGLAAAGAVFQGILLNPLADPYTLGVSAGAAFGASLAILINLKMAIALPIPVFAFLAPPPPCFW